MWHSIFAPELPYAEKILRTVLVYALVAVLIRLAGKRSLAGLNTLDLVVMLLLSNVVQNAIIGPDNSVTGAAVGAAVLIAVDAVLNQIAARSTLGRTIFDGTPTPLVTDGRKDEGEMKRLGISNEELEHAVRLQNGDDIRQLQSATMLPEGELLLTLKPLEQGATKRDVDDLRAQLDRIERALGLDTADAT